MHPIVNHNAIKQRFRGYKDYPGGFAEAVANRPQDIKAAQPELLKQIECSGMNPYKKVELWKQYRPIVSPEDQSNPLYKKTPQDIINIVAGEKKSRKGFNKGMNARKKDIQRKANNKAKLEDLVNDEKKEVLDSC